MAGARKTNEFAPKLEPRKMLRIYSITMVEIDTRIVDRETRKETLRRPEIETASSVDHKIVMFLGLAG